jgi:hypothetical protein
MQIFRIADVTYLTSEHIGRKLPWLSEFIIAITMLTCMQEHFTSPI